MDKILLKPKGYCIKENMNKKKKKTKSNTTMKAEAKGTKQ